MQRHIIITLLMATSCACALGIAPSLKDVQSVRLLSDPPIVNGRFVFDRSGPAVDARQTRHRHLAKMLADARLLDLGPLAGADGWYLRVGFVMSDTGELKRGRNGYVVSVELSRTKSSPTGAAAQKEKLWGAQAEVMNLDEGYVAQARLVARFIKDKKRADRPRSVRN